jgi:hypothetical protein
MYNRPTEQMENPSVHFLDGFILTFGWPGNEVSEGTAGEYATFRGRLQRHMQNILFYILPYAAFSMGKFQNGLQNFGFFFISEKYWTHPTSGQR